MNNFEDFLNDCLERGADQIRLVPRIDAATGNVEFYAHPQGVSGETFEGEVSGKHVRNITGRNSAEDAEADAERTEAAEAEVARAEAADAKAEAAAEAEEDAIEAADERWANEGGASDRSDIDALREMAEADDAAREDKEKDAEG